MAQKNRGLRLEDCSCALIETNTSLDRGSLEGREVGVIALIAAPEGVATRFVQNCTLSLSLKGFDAVGDRNPALRTLHPDEVAWSEPTCVIKRAGFEGDHVLDGLRNMIDAGSAIRTEHTRNLVATVGDTRKLLRHAGHCQAVFLHRHGHAEGAAGLALAFFAVAGNQADWFRRQYVTH
jgi:hypothetical protein